MTTIENESVQIESSSNPNVKISGLFDVNPEKIVFKPEERATGDYGSRFKKFLKILCSPKNLRLF